MPHITTRLNLLSVLVHSYSGVVLVYLFLWVLYISGRGREVVGAIFMCMPSVLMGSRGGCAHCVSAFMGELCVLLILITQWLVQY